MNIMDMEEIREEINRAIRIINGEEGPQLSCDYAYDAVYIYPKRLLLIEERLIYILDHTGGSPAQTTHEETQTTHEDLTGHEWKRFQPDSE
jgi:hypothetical protein